MLKIFMFLLIVPAMEKALRPLSAEESAGLPRYLVILDKVAFWLYGVIPTSIILGTIALFAVDDFFKWLHGV